MKKYKLTDIKTEIDGHTLYRIIALKDINIKYYYGGPAKIEKTVKAGELGGWIETEYNLSQYGTCWIYEGFVYGTARVIEDAFVDGRARIKDNAVVGGKAHIGTGSVISGQTSILSETYIENSTIRNLDLISGVELRGIYIDKTIKGPEPTVNVETVVKLIRGMTQEKRNELYSRIIQEGLI